MAVSLFSKWNVEGWMTPTEAMEPGECSTVWNSSSTILAFWQLETVIWMIELRKKNKWMNNSVKS